MRTLLLTLTTCLFVLPAYAKYSGGSGMAGDPYRIATAADLIALGETPADYDKHFILTADIDLDPNLPSRKVFDKAVIAADTNANTLYQFDGTPFAGVLDGNGHTISHMTIQGATWVGLFGNLAWAAEVRDLGLVDVNVGGSGSSVGGLVGMNRGSVTQCYCTGAVRAAGNCVGGLVGYNFAAVTQCYSTGAVVGNAYVGGLVGDNGGSVTQCYSTGAVVGNAYVGGLVGDNGGSVTQCYSTGAVVGNAYVGGLVGDNSYGTVTQCYSTGPVIGNAYVGGLVGSNDVGGPVAESLWDTQTSGQATSAGGTGKTTAKMRDVQTYRGAGWDFLGKEDGLHEIWQMPEGGRYPVLAIFNGYTPPRLQGSGTMKDAYLVADGLDLGAMVYYSPTAHYRLIAPIDLSGVCWVGAVIPRFAGTFDGNSLTISHLRINGGSYLGLFGRLESGAEVKGLGVVDVNITGSGSCVGGLVGDNGGTVTQCYSTGAVDGNEHVAGLVGDNDTESAIVECYSTGTVSGSQFVGGFVGENDTQSAIVECYSTGAISGTRDFVGGLVGGNSGYVTCCYSTGAVAGEEGVGGLVGHPVYGFGSDKSGAVVAASFWDTQTSGQADSADGDGKTTGEMQDPNTFRAAGWDFVGEADGPGDIWAMPAGGGYPILWWQLSSWPSLPKFSGGTGEPNDPYRISTAKDLNSIGHNPRLMKCHFKLVADLDLTGFHFYPIGNPDNPYGGVFDGSGHTISHLTIQGESYVGLFAYLGSGGEVKDLGVVDVNVIASGYSVGGLVGSNEGGAVTHCYSTGAVSGQYAVGGLVGDNGGTVTQCYSTGAVSGQYAVGGLVGYNWGTVTQCYSTGAVSGDQWVGGLVGDNNGRVTQCYSTGAVSGQHAVGGLVGCNAYGTVTACYSTGVVSGNEWVGGLVGGNDDGAVTLCFWDIQTSGQTTSAAGTGKTTAEMQTAPTFLEAGWDFVGETANGTEDTWWIDEGKDYPRLWWETGDEASP